MKQYSRMKILQTNIQYNIFDNCIKAPFWNIQINLNGLWRPTTARIVGLPPSIKFFTVSQRPSYEGFSWTPQLSVSLKSKASAKPKKMHV